MIAVIRKNNRQNGKNHRSVALSLSRQAFYSNLEVLLDEEMAELMKNPRIREWARRVTIEGFELILREMKEKWA